MPRTSNAPTAVRTSQRLPLHASDLALTYADVSKAQRRLNYVPTTSIEAGIQKFVVWFKTTLLW